MPPCPSPPLPSPCATGIFTVSMVLPFPECHCPGVPQPGAVQSGLLAGPRTFTAPPRPFVPAGVPLGLLALRGFSRPPSLSGPSVPLPMLAPPTCLHFFFVCLFTGCLFLDLRESDRGPLPGCAPITRNSPRPIGPAQYTFREPNAGATRTPIPFALLFPPTRFSGDRLFHAHRSGLRSEEEADIRVKSLSLTIISCSPFAFGASWLSAEFNGCPGGWQLVASAGISHGTREKRGSRE